MYRIPPESARKSIQTRALQPLGAAPRGGEAARIAQAGQMMSSAQSAVGDNVPVGDALSVVSRFSVTLTEQSAAEKIIIKEGPVELANVSTPVPSSNNESGRASPDEPESGCLQKTWGILKKADFTSLPPGADDTAQIKAVLDMVSKQIEEIEGYYTPSMALSANDPKRKEMLNMLNDTKMAIHNILKSKSKKESAAAIAFTGGTLVLPTAFLVQAKSPKTFFTLMPYYMRIAVTSGVFHSQKTAGMRDALLFFIQRMSQLEMLALSQVNVVAGKKSLGSIYSIVTALSITFISLILSNPKLSANAGKKIFRKCMSEPEKTHLSGQNLVALQSTKQQLNIAISEISKSLKGKKLGGQANIQISETIGELNKLLTRLNETYIDPSPVEAVANPDKAEKSAVTAAVIAIVGGVILLTLDDPANLPISLGDAVFTVLMVMRNIPDPSSSTAITLSDLSAYCGANILMLIFLTIDKVAPYIGNPGTPIGEIPNKLVYAVAEAAFTLGIFSLPSIAGTVLAKGMGKGFDAINQCRGKESTVADELDLTSRRESIGGDEATRTALLAARSANADVLVRQITAARRRDADADRGSLPNSRTERVTFADNASPSPSPEPGRGNNEWGDQGSPPDP